MKHHEYIVALVLIIGIALGFISTYHPEDKQSLKESKEQIYQLRQHADSLEHANKALDTKYLILQQHADSIQQALQVNSHHYNQLKQNKHEAITHLYNLNADGIYKFFSDFKTEDPSGK